MINCTLLDITDRPDDWEAYIAHHVNSKRVAEYVKGLEAQKQVRRWIWAEVGAEPLLRDAANRLRTGLRRTDC